ncbi:MAG: HlyD family efflux transporter periplasmic adaptor subunit, partial [Verrucomicrobiota bacterium]
LKKQNAASPRGSRWVVAGLGALLIIAGFIPVPEIFEGDCELQPAQRFTVVAEVEGRIQSIDAREGAIVQAGQPLAQLDVSALRTRLEVMREQFQEHEAQARRAQGLQDMTSYRLAKLKAGQNAQEGAALEEDIRRSKIVAPIDGKILTKDLAQKQGTVLRLGDTLCEVGGFNAWNLQVALPEEDLSAFLRALEKSGRLQISYRLKAGATLVLSAEVNSIAQISEMAYPVEGRNVIYVTAPSVKIPEELLGEMRPGFSGRARIEGSRRAWALISTRRLMEYLRLHWWL